VESILPFKSNLTIKNLPKNWRCISRARDSKDKKKSVEKITLFFKKICPFLLKSSRKSRLKNSPLFFSHPLPRMQIEITRNGKKPEREVTKPNLIFWKNYEKG